MTPGQICCGDNVLLFAFLSRVLLLFYAYKIHYIYIFLQTFLHLHFFKLLGTFVIQTETEGAALIVSVNALKTSISFNLFGLKKKTFNNNKMLFFTRTSGEKTGIDATFLCWRISLVDLNLSQMVSKREIILVGGAFTRDWILQVTLHQLLLIPLLFFLFIVHMSYNSVFFSFFLFTLTFVVLKYSLWVC